MTAGSSRSSTARGSRPRTAATDSVVTAGSKPSPSSSMPPVSICVVDSAMAVVCRGRPTPPWRTSVAQASSVTATGGGRAGHSARGGEEHDRERTHPYTQTHSHTLTQALDHLSTSVSRCSLSLSLSLSLRTHAWALSPPALAGPAHGAPVHPAYTAYPPAPRSGPWPKLSWPAAQRSGPSTRTAGRRASSAERGRRSPGSRSRWCSA